MTRSGCHRGASSKEARLQCCTLDWISAERSSTSVCSPSQGEHLDQLAAPPDARRAEDPRPAHRRGPPRAGLRGDRVDDRRPPRPRHARAGRLGRSRSPTPQKVKGLAPLACKTDKIDSRVLAVLEPARPGAGDLAPRSEGARGARARPLSPPPGQAQVGAQEPDPLDPDQLRQALPGHRPVRSRGPQAARTPPSPGALARQHHRLASS